jgi:hypothetical protein
MPSRHSMFVSKNESCLASVESENDFFVREVLWDFETYNNDNLYEQIVFKVIGRPKRLILHMQRIYFTHHHGMKEQLYAALVDFLWVLDGKGKKLGHRMIYATQSLLSEQQFEVLKKYLTTQNNQLFIGNKFSLFSSGMIGSGILLTEKKISETHYDVIDIARDYIEFSQLDAAKETLEIAVLEMPQRQDLQIELLELYKVTKDFQAFMDINNKLEEKGITFLAEWLEFSVSAAGKAYEA